MNDLILSKNDAEKQLAKQQLAKDVLNMRYAILKKLYEHDLLGHFENVWKWVVNVKTDWVFRGNIIHDIVLSKDEVDRETLLPEANGIYKLLTTPINGLKVAAKKK
jgi:hypothetical protein